MLVSGITVNLALICYFKYANFFLDTYYSAIGKPAPTINILLPLAISFFTFQQITYLVDAYRGITREYSFLHYCLFVTFFPQLIAGPIVHHREMMPQFASDTMHRLRTSNLSVGLTLFSLGLFKKVIIADGVSVYANEVFQAASAGATLTLMESWAGALAYTFQLYFDFSGYSDMALGLGRMFGIKLPLNFYSPYKATSIIDFWRRWHMTLSRFLKDYLYIPLGGNKKGRFRRHTNLMVTMLLGGLWHGAGWTFVFWGGLHGIYLIINHLWRHQVTRRAGKNRVSTPAGRFIARFITFIAVVFSWVFFRAEDFDSAIYMTNTMLGFNGFDWSAGWDAWTTNIHSTESFLKRRLPVLLFIVWLMPNTWQIMRRFEPSLPSESMADTGLAIEWSPGRLWGIAMGAILAYSVLNLTVANEFLYFQF